MTEQKLSVLLCLLVCAGAGAGHALRILADVDAEDGREFAFGSRNAAGAESAMPEPDPSSEDYDHEISRVEFEPPEVGTSYATAAASGPATAVSAAAATGSGSMKWSLPPSTTPSFANPGGMPGGIPGMPLPAMPGMPFNPVGCGAAPTPPGQAPPAPPAAAGASVANPDPNDITN